MSPTVGVQPKGDKKIKEHAVIPLLVAIPCPVAQVVYQGVSTFLSAGDIVHAVCPGCGDKTAVLVVE